MMKKFMGLAVALVCGGLWAAVPTPVAHWTEFSEGKTGDDAGKFTVSAGTGCTFTDGKAVTTKSSTTANTGLLVQWEDGSVPAGSLTVVVKYSGYDASGLGNNSLIATQWGDSNEEVAYATGGGANAALSANVTTTSGGSQSAASPAYMPPTAGYMMVTMSTDGNYGTSFSFLPSDGTFYKQATYQSGHRYSGAAFKGIKIGGTWTEIGKYHRPGLTIEEVKLYAAKVTASDLNDEIEAALPAVSFTKANATDWESKTLPAHAVSTEVTENTSFAGKPAYLQSLTSGDATVALVTDVASGKYVYGLHAFEGENGIGAITRDIYLKVSGGSAAVVSGGEDAGWNSSTKTIPTGNVLVNVDGESTTVDYIYGAGLGGGTGNGLAKINGNVGIVVEGNAQVKGSIIAGWQSRHNTVPEVTGNTSVLIKNVQTHYQDATLATDNQKCEQGWIAAGGIFKTNGGRTKVGGNASVTVDLPNTAEGTFNKNIVAGGIGIGGGDGQNVTGNGTVTITAPNTVTFAKTIVGGGHSTGNNARIGGNTSVTLNGGTYTGTIYAGGDHSAATVGGTATLTINGGVFTGATLKGGTATGTKKLVFNCDQEFAWANIAGFDEIAIADAKKLTMSVAGSNDRELTCALTGAGTLEKTGTGTLRVVGGTEGKIIAKAGTLCIKLTTEQQLAGYTSQVTIDGGTLKFTDMSGTELTNASSDPTIYEMPKNVWVGTAGDANWDTAANWSYGTVPTNGQIIELGSEMTINVSSSSVCQQLVVNANVNLVGQIAANAMPNIIIANEKTLTIEATGESTLNGVSGGTLVKEGTATLNVKPGSGSDTAVLHDMAVVIKGGKILINQPSSPEATLHDVAFTIEESACGDDKVPLDNYGWFSATGPWSITTTGNARIFNNNTANTSVIKGNGAFTKLGSGKVTLLSALGNSGNVYSGTVTVSEGELLIDPSGDGHTSTVSGKLTVASDATLSIHTTANFTHNGATNTKDIEGTLNINAGTTTMKGSDRGFRGTLNVAKGATFKVDRNDYFSYQGESVTVNVRGTLDFQTYRQTLRETVSFNFYEGCTVSGFGSTDNSGWSSAMQIWNADHTSNINFLASDDDETGIVNFDTTLGLQNSATFTVAEGVTVVCNGATSGDNSRNLVNVNGTGKSITKAGAGTLKIATAYTTDTVLAAGTLQVATAETMPTVSKSDANKKVSDDTTTLEGYTTYTLVARDATNVYVTNTTPTYVLNDNTETTLVDGDVVIFDSHYSGNKWSQTPKMAWLGGHKGIIDIEMDIGGGIPANQELVVNYKDLEAAEGMKGNYLYGDIGANANISGTGALFLGFSNSQATIADGVTISCDTGFQSSGKTAIINGTVTFSGGVHLNGSAFKLAEGATLTVATELDDGAVQTDVDGKQVKVARTEDGVEYSLEDIPVPAPAEAGVSGDPATMQPVLTITDAPANTEVTVTVTAGETEKTYTATSDAQGTVTVPLSGEGKTLDGDKGYTYVATAGGATVAEGGFVTGDVYFRADPAGDSLNGSWGETAPAVSGGAFLIESEDGMTFTIADKTPAAGKAVLIDQTVTFSGVADLSEIDESQLSEAVCAVTVVEETVEETTRTVWKAWNDESWTTLDGTVPELPATVSLKMVYDPSKKTFTVEIKSQDGATTYATSSATVKKDDVSGVTYIGNGELAKLEGVTAPVIAYIGIDESQKLAVNVSEAFAREITGKDAPTRAEVQAALNENANTSVGLKKWQAYVLGVTTADDLAEVDLVVDFQDVSATARTLSFSDGYTANRQKAGVRVTRTVLAGTDLDHLEPLTATEATDTAVTITLPESAPAVNYFKIRYDFE